MVIAFLDASAVIYAVEGTEAWAEALKQQLRHLAATAETSAGGLQLAISRLSWLDCRVGPLRRRDAEALTQGPLEVCPSSAGAPPQAPVWCAGLAPVRWPRSSRIPLLQPI